MEQTIKKINNFGYSIIEVLAAFTIITVGMVGVLTLSIQNINTHKLTRNTIIASQLAQEGVELVRNKRDENWLTEGNNWKTGTGANSQSDIVQDGTYAIDYTGSVFAANDIEDAAAKLKIKLLAAAGMARLYNHSVGEDTIFYRLITITPVDATSPYLDVESKVRWAEGGFKRDYIVKTVLYNWR